MNSLQQLETLKLGNWEYNRSEFTSPALGGKKVTFGLLKNVSNATPANAPQGTVYLFHGGNGNDRQPIDLGIQNLLPLKSVQFCFPFIGTSFLHEPFSKYFFDEILPLVESHTTTTEQTRWIAGYSMGGQAALNTFLRAPKKFKGVGAHFPTLITFPYESEKETLLFQKRTGISDDMLKVLRDGFTNEFKSATEFSHYNPIHLISTLDLNHLQDKQIYFDVGSQDEFGLHEGCTHLSGLFKAKKIPHTFSCIEGGHHDGAFLQAQLPKMFESLLGS